MTEKAYTVTIRWGSTYPSEGDLKTYTFLTEEEMHSFLDGVDEAMGWLDYEVME